MEWVSMRLIQHNVESLARPDLTPPPLIPLPHATRGGEGMDRFSLQEQIYDLFF